MGFTIRSVADGYGLNFIPVTWEYFDFVIPLERLRKKSIKVFIKELKSDKFKSYIRKLPGYKIHSELGNIVEIH